MKTEYEAGAPIRRLAEKYGIAFGTVRTALVSVGTQLRGPGRRGGQLVGRPHSHIPKVGTPERMALELRIARLSRDGHSSRTVAREVGLGVSFVSSVIAAMRRSLRE